METYLWELVKDERFSKQESPLPAGKQEPPAVAQKRRSARVTSRLVDPERGIVIGYAILYYGDSQRRMQIKEIFKILNGRIRMVVNIGLMEEGITTSGFTE